ncbi:MAG: hypothetical protein ABJN36_09545 [Cyclobacteriaceae bacterium]
MAKTSTKELFSKCIILGTGTDKIVLDESQVFSLIHIAIQDIGWKSSDFNIPDLSNSIPSNNYFEIPLDWYSTNNVLSKVELLEVLQSLVEFDSDFGLYFKNLCELHKRRIKYQNILSNQPKPTMEQIAPRGLLEYGLNNTELLSNWMIWRKWIFDIDNRSGQETGYLFEPILASSLGGTPISSSKSPVKRIDLEGSETKGGRQIDCYVASENIAYEFKLRVTIAASGQGRFAEELSFPRECKAANIKPVLLVLDSTPSDRLTDLSNAFIKEGGETFIGEEAWNHMEEKAGEVISVFIEKYIKLPLLTIADGENDDISPINLTWTSKSITISDGKSTYEINRKE